MTAEKPTRRRRFRRDPAFKSEKSRAGRLELRERDLEMVTAVASHRFMNTEQVCRLFACGCPRVESIGRRAGAPAAIWIKQHRANCACSCGAEGSKREHQPGCRGLFKDEKHVASRLRELYQAGYLERPIVQLQLRVKEGVITKGSVPLVYCVTRAGLDLIGEVRRARLGHGKMSWVGKVNEGTRVFLEHTLAVGEFSVGLDCALRERRDLQRLSEAALMSGMSEVRRASERPWSLRVHYKGEALTGLCDLVVAVENQERERQWNFLVEVDRGHMPIERAGLSHTSIMRKLIAYAKAYEDGLHRSEFGWRGMRVVILTTSAKRVASCVAAALKRFKGAAVARIFLFGTMDAASDPLGYEYVDGTGRPCSLVEPSILAR